MTLPKIIIIILNWNGQNDTVECVKSLENLTYPHYEILIVDNGSTDYSVKVFRKLFPDIEIISNSSNLGYAEGNNVGIRKAIEKNADYILLLNNDTVVEKSFLAELVNSAELDKSIGFAGPLVYYYDYKGRKDIVRFAEGRLSLWKGESYHTGAKQADIGQFNQVKEVDYAEGSCILVRKTLIQKIGLLDPEYFAYWEESDWCLRGRKANFKAVIVPKAKIWHKVSASATSKGTAYYMARNRFIFMRKNANKYQRAIFMFYFFIYSFWYYSLVYLVYHRNFSLFKAHVTGTKDGIFYINH